MKISVYSFISLIFLFACDSSRIFEEFEDINGSWAVGDTSIFRVEIDSGSLPYDIDFHVKNQMSYPFHNLYFQVIIEGPDGHEISRDLKEVILFDPKTGKPRGSGLADSFESSVRIYEDIQFDQPGMYRFMVNQFMRMDTLPAIERVGLKVSISDNP